EFADLAEFFTRTTAGKATEFGLPPLPDGDDLGRLFYTVAACYARRAAPVDEPTGPRQVEDVFSFHYDVKTGQPRLASGGFVHALELLQRLKKSSPPTAR